MTTFTSKSIEDLPSIAQQLLPDIISYKTVCFHAQMGAGKTTLIKQVCIALGVDEKIISSPTYSLVNEYKGANYTIYHFDFYRLKNIEEAYDFGIEEYFEKGAICLMEWPEIVETLIPKPCLNIRIEVEEEERIITAEIEGNTFKHKGHEV